MALLFWDASALAKRYTTESGTATANAIFGVTPQDMASTTWNYAETYAILVRRLNGGILDAATFALSAASLQAEVVNNPDFLLLNINETQIFTSVSLIRKHNLNATDSALLQLLLDFQQTPGAPKVVLLASDKRLIRAAEAEGFKVLNPETMNPADVPQILASL